jgi:hypothetical protein
MPKRSRTREGHNKLVCTQTKEDESGEVNRGVSNASNEFAIVKGVIMFQWIPWSIQFLEVFDERVDGNITVDDFGELA